MIKSILLENFESHKKTLIEFDKGLNVISGSSNIGKSAILRAFDLVLYGNWDKDSVRVGEKHARVKIETELGYVEVKRAKSRLNEWKICPNGEKEIVVKNPGSGPIDEINKIIPLVTKTINGKQTRINWHSQFDRHFILSDLDGQKATPSLVASLLDEIGGISGCEDLIRLLAKDRDSNVKESAKYFNESQEIKEQLKLIPDLEELDKILSKIEKLKESKKRTEEEIEDILLKERQIEKINNDIDLIVYPSKNKLFSIKNKQELGQELFDEIKSIDKLINEYSIVMSKYEDSQKIPEFNCNDLINRIEEKANDVKSINNKLKEYDNIRSKDKQLESIPDFDSSGLITSIKENIEIIKKIKELGVNFNRINREFNSINEDLEKLENDKKEIEKKKKEFKVCPLCGKSTTQG